MGLVKLQKNIKLLLLQKTLRWLGRSYSLYDNQYHVELIPGKETIVTSQLQSMQHGNLGMITSIILLVYYKYSKIRNFQLE